MITRESINVAIGPLIDSALESAGIPAERRKSDDPAPIDRRSIQIQLDELQIDPMGDIRQVTQSVTVYFFPENADRYRDEIWIAANAVEEAMIEPLIVDGVAIRCDDEGVLIDMSTEVMEIRFNLTWFEVVDLDEEYELIETLEEDLNYGTFT